MKRELLIIASLFAIAGCSKPLKCDEHGMIIQDRSASNARQLEVDRLNTEFLERRSKAAIGLGGHYTADALDKATGCP